MEEILSGTKKIKFVHDTYWTAKSSIAPTAQIKDFKDRLLGVHLRDLTLYKSGLKVLSRDCALGDGVLDFSEILTEARKCGAEYFVIEQKTDTPYEDIKKSYTYLNTLEVN